MKVPAAVLCILTFAVWALAAPVVILDKLPSQSNASKPVRLSAEQIAVLSKTKNFILSFVAPSSVSIEKNPHIVVAGDGQHIQLPENLAGAKTWETPNVLHFLSSLTRPKKPSPFPESSIMREETRANLAEIEPQESIVELETKAERESWTYIPYYVSRDDVLRFHRVRKAADTVMFAVPISILTAAVLCTLCASFRRRFHSSQTSRMGAIRLEDEEEAIYPTQHTYLVLWPVPETEARLGIIEEKS
ncbi:hypothetical protein AAE478_008614 [Parahypoxylon ruwenzoriense]